MTVLLITTFLTPLGAFAAMQARLDLLMEHATRAALEAFATAEAGLNHALADLALDPSFDRLLAGPDGTAGTADDGQFPFLRPQVPMSLGPSLSYALTVGSLDTDVLEIVSVGRADLGSQRAVAARLRRAQWPTVPAAVGTASADLHLILGTDIGMSGNDRAGHDDALPALVVGADAMLGQALASIPSGLAAHLVGRGGTPSVSATDLGAIVNRLSAAAADPRAVGIGPAGPIGDGFQVASGTLSLAGDVTGSGLLAVQGDLEVTGHLTFSGVMFINGDVHFARDSDVHLTGTLVQGPAGRQLELSGTGDIAYDSAALTDFDTKFPGLLPHGARVVGWREVF